MTLFSDYLQAIAEKNSLCSPEHIAWLFYPGMLFSSKAKWWGDFKYRATRHEGIDICWYISPGDHTMRQIGAGARVPAMSGGIILNVCRDFLGHTIIVSYPPSRNNSWPVVFAYAHVVPEKKIQTGKKIQKGQVIATVVDTFKNPMMPPHLHFSCFEITSDKSQDQYDWSVFTDEEHTRMISPVFL